MQNIGDSTPSVQDQFVDAKALKDMTLTEEELFQIQKENLTMNLMSSMVSVATKQGRDFYAAQLLTSMTDRLMTEVRQSFDDLGYITDVSDVVKDSKSGQEFVVLTISWKEA